ncbi:hypothetical protein FDECE_830 [Fusarium decemcellulare]|nr:hypothetical protein FDECE_830 [Fusarium decemcellulare]
MEKHHCWSGSVIFNPDDDIPDLSGKVCLVTGGNTGLGLATIKALAKHHPAKIYLAARSRSKAEAARSEIHASSPEVEKANIDILDLDVASFPSIKAAAERVNKEVDRLDVLQLNAGIAMISFFKHKTAYEIQFATNYLGHALLTQLLMPKLLATAAIPGADVRIVAMSSVGHRAFAPSSGILFDEVKSDMAGHGGHELYGQAMLAKSLFAYELAKRYPQITSTSLHPGTVKSGVWAGDKGVNWIIFNVFVKPAVALTGVSNEEGCKTQLWCSFSKEVKNGAYYEPIGIAGKESKLAHDDELAARLWEWTDKELQTHGAPGWKQA